MAGYWASRVWSVIDAAEPNPMIRRVKDSLAIDFVHQRQMVCEFQRSGAFLHRVHGVARQTIVRRAGAPAQSTLSLILQHIVTTTLTPTI